MVVSVQEFREVAGLRLKTRKHKNTGPGPELRIPSYSEDIGFRN